MVVGQRFIYGDDLYMMVPDDESVKTAKARIEELY